jgi:hypothetical protein
LDKWSVLFDMSTEVFDEFISDGLDNPTFQANTVVSHDFTKHAAVGDLRIGTPAPPNSHGPQDALDCRKVKLIIDGVRIEQRSVDIEYDSVHPWRLTLPLSRRVEAVGCSGGLTNGSSLGRVQCERTLMKDQLPSPCAIQPEGTTECHSCGPSRLRRLKQAVRREGNARNADPDSEFLDAPAKGRGTG